MTGWLDRLTGRRPERPFLILTLRRTGGTALTGALSRASSYPAARHEPFNVDREFGDLTAAFSQDGEGSVLRDGIAERLGRRPNLKHCVETVPWGVTRALVDVALDRDYGLAVLTRRDEARRLRSLAIARATGAWGPRQLGPREAEFASGARRPVEIDLAALRRAIAGDAAALGTTLRLLRNRQVDHDWWVFEDIYDGTAPVTARAAALARRFGMSCSAEDAAFAPLAESRAESAGIAAYVSNLAEADALLAQGVVD